MIKAVKEQSGRPGRPKSAPAATFKRLSRRNFTGLKRQSAAAEKKFLR